MMPPQAKPLDVLCLGETVVDLIATEEHPSLEMSPTFERTLGGSPANVAVQIARLGGTSAVVSKVGDDPLGHYCRRALDSAGVSTQFLQLDPATATTHVFLSRTAGTPEFVAFRGADAHLQREDIPERALARSRAVHTTAFALSRDPCRSALVTVLKHAAASGQLVSLDPNYHPALWPDRNEALATLADLYPHVTLTKPSLDDAMRLFGTHRTVEHYLDDFHALGATTVVLSMGAEGIWLSSARERMYFEPQRFSVANATGAGDAFIAGLLLSRLDGIPLENAVRFARECSRWWLTGYRERITGLERLARYEEIAPNAEPRREP